MLAKDNNCCYSLVFKKEAGPISVWQRLKETLTFQEPRGMSFELADTGNKTAGPGEDTGDYKDGGPAQTNQNEPGASKEKERTVKSRGRSRGMRKPVRPGSGAQNHKDNIEKGAAQEKPEPVIDPGKLKVSGHLDQDVAYLKRVFHVPKNNDVVFREFSIGIDNPVRAIAIYIDGMTDKAIQNDSVLQPLMLLSRLRLDAQEGNLEDVVRERLLPGNQVEIFELMRATIDGVLNGDTVILIEGVDKALVMETKGWEHRNVGKPEVEMVVRGPHEAFNETFRVNTALIRKAFHSPDLVTEIFKVGNKDRINCGIMYLDGVVNQDLVQEAKRRIEMLETDYVGTSGILEQFIEDKTYALAPQVLSTERPDRVINHIIEGKVAVLMDGSPHVLVFPMNLFGILQSAEDAYLRWPYGSLLRMLRLVGVFLATFLPGIYVAVNAYHHEMIPTDLLMAIAGAREQVPFPTIVEVLIMEISFELIREAGIRVPGVIGPTLGIVGALILGQAAVAAKVVSPILIVIVAVTAIGSFTVPNYTLAFSIRAVRFVYIVLGGLFGFFGIVLGFFIHLNHLSSLKSFGVPFLSPLGVKAEGGDVIWRKPIWQQEERPGSIAPRKIKSQPPISRRWINRKKGGNADDYQ